MTPRQQRLGDNLSRVLGSVGDACRRAHRSAGSVRLVAVTKTVPTEVAADLIALGQTHFGENRVQELLKKSQELPRLAPNASPTWHMIGHLQTNKVRKLLPVCSFIHSVDSVRLADEIDRVAAGISLTPAVLIEVNVSEEASKHGVSPQALRELAEHCGRLTHLQLKGLMTMAPVVEDPEETRPLFARLRTLAEELREARIPGVEMSELSMGMTQDYAVAVEEGATLIRVGSALFKGL